MTEILFEVKHTKFILIYHFDCCV